MLGLATDALGKRTHLPRVTLLLMFGIILGKPVLDIIPDLFIDNYGVIADIALVMVGFLVGGKLTRSALHNSGMEVLIISICAVIVTTLVVAAGLFVLKLPIEIAILLGCISAATAPAATLDVAIELNRKNAFVDRLIAIVALDDILGLIIFSLCLAYLTAGTNGVNYTDSPLIFALKDVLGAILIGIIIGFPAAFLTGKVSPGRPLMIEAVGLILICGGLAKWLDVSHLIASIVMGSVVANFAKHHKYSFHEIENIEWPIMVLFFTLAGASLQFVSVNKYYYVLLIYLVLRIVGKIAGSYTGSLLAKSDESVRKWMGCALLPQAGVAIGMVLVASSYFPAYKNDLLTIVIAATIVFELIGPIFTRMAINKSSA